MPILIIYLSGTPITLPLASGATVINPAVMMNKPPDRLVMQQFPFFFFFTCSLENQNVSFSFALRNLLSLLLCSSHFLFL